MRVCVCVCLCRGEAIKPQGYGLTPVEPMKRLGRQLGLAEKWPQNHSLLFHGRDGDNGFARAGEAANISLHKHLHLFGAVQVYVFICVAVSCACASVRLYE